MALAAVLLSAITVVATRQLLTQRLDAQLDSVVGRQQSGPPNGRPGDRTGIVQVGNPQNTIYAAFTDDGRSESAIASGRGAPPRLDQVVVSQLGSLPIDARKRTVQIAGLGRYRVATYNFTIPMADGTVGGHVAVGIPVRDVDPDRT